MKPSKRRTVINENIATIQVDVDSFEVINEGYSFNYGCHNNGDPIILHTIPVYLDLFKEFGVNATFFLVGRDLENDHNVTILREITDYGHEVANHSYQHNGFDFFATEDRFDDIRKCHEIIRLKLGIECRGFKAPCYALDPALIGMLEKLGYEYDSSMISTIISSLMKMYYRLVIGEKIHPSNWGYLSHLFAPTTAYYPDCTRVWRRGERDILEIPITTLPFLRTPIHFSFVNVFGPMIFSIFNLMKFTQPNILNYAFHAVDLIPNNILPKDFYRRPGLKRDFQWRLDQAKWILEEIIKTYQIKTSFSVSETFRSRCTD